jgi:hypothetical protein
MANITADDLVGRTVKIEASRLEAHHARVTFADTGETLDNIERIEIDMDARQITKAVLYLVHIDKTTEEGIVRETAETTDVELSTLARVVGVRDGSD